MALASITPDTIKGSNAERSRSSNRQAVLGHIHTAGRMGRAELARALGLSTQAVSNIIADLEREGLLIETGVRSAGRGLPAIQYAVNPGGGYAMGIEIRPDALFTALVDLQGAVAAKGRQPLAAHTPDIVVEAVRMLRAKMLAQTGIAESRLLGAGIVMPGPFGQTGLSGLGLALTGWQKVNAARLFEEALQMPVELSNDANAAAMAERIGGTAQGVSHFAYLYFGAGLGLGLISRGQLVAGAFGNAGEIGHIPIPTAEGPQPLETLVSRASVQRALAARGPLDIAALDALYSEGAEDLMGWLSQACTSLGQAVALIENLFDPQTIILGGAMPRAVLDHMVAHTPRP
ncbi:MAG: ROK family transcriptional regulator, partial [Pseudomonadota bacterium]